jgi:biopolymer transport protein ExbB/TolQ
MSKRAGGFGRAVVECGSPLALSIQSGAEAAHSKRNKRLGRDTKDSNMTPLIETLYLLSTALMVPVILALLGLLIWSLLEIGGFVREARERRRCVATWQDFLKESASPEGSPSVVAGSPDPATSGDRRSLEQTRTPDSSRPSVETVSRSGDHDTTSEAVSRSGDRDTTECGTEPESTPAQRRNATAFFERSDYPGLVACFAERGRAVQADPLRLAKLVSELEIEAAGRLARMSFGVRIGPILGLMGTLIPMGPALIGLSSGDIDVMARNLVVAFSTTVLGLLVGGICYGIWLVRRQWYARDLSDIEYVYQCISESGGSADAA